MDHVPVVVLGLGPTGLAAATALQRASADYVGIERDPTVGGLARTLVRDTALGTFRFDLTGHFLHVRSDRTRQLCERVLAPGTFVEHARRASVYVEGAPVDNHLVDAPFQQAVHQLPPPVREAATRELEALARRAAAPAVGTFGEHECARFGETLGAMSVGYARKVYGPGVEALAAEQMARFSPQLSIATLLAGCEGPIEQEHYNSRFGYSWSGGPGHGIGTLTDALAAQLPPERLWCGARPVALDPRRHQLTLADGRRIEYDRLISSIPLPALIQLGPPSPAAEAMSRTLRAQPVRWLALGLRCPPDREVLDGRHWIYVLSPALPFYRIGCFSNVDTAMAPPGCASLWAEFAIDRPADPEADRRALIRFLGERGWLVRASDVVYTEWSTIAPAYVLMDAHTATTARALHEELAAHDIVSAGRYGTWTYASVDDALHQGLLLGQEAATATDAPVTAEEWTYKHVYSQPLPGFRLALQDALGGDFAVIAERLDRLGIVRLRGLFDRAHVAEMQRDFSAWCDERPHDAMGHVQFDGATNDAYLTRSLALSGALTPPLIWALAAHAWGRDPTLAYCRSYSLLPHPPVAYRAFRPHIDGHGKELKAMVLLSDVPPDGQRMRYWPGTHQLGWRARASTQTWFTDAETAALPFPALDCGGPAGTVFVFYTNGIHTGTRNLGPRRDAIVFNLTGGARLYRIPALHPDVASALDPYERGLFRIDPLREDARPAWLARHHERIRADARDAVDDVLAPDALAAGPLAQRDRPFSDKPAPLPRVPCFREPPRAVGTDEIAERLWSDLHGDLELPIHQHRSDRDALRDEALGRVRDSFMTIAELERLAAVVVDAATRPAPAWSELTAAADVLVDKVLPSNACLVRDLVWAVEHASGPVLAGRGLAMLLATAHAVEGAELRGLAAAGYARSLTQGPVATDLSENLSRLSRTKS
jgi:protoporphyrinogen oxidase